ncbi:uncharacterized protein LOC109720038 [Ananas comosus]|uniref:Uncharacterized protein LOC109720038 n=1 Tax=Ananas comosus TaxID=4615 RepID=A0A6P5G3T8_ANACO|nr:uncharacterized protein LOC109720038 [Ananas comosus]
MGLHASTNILIKKRENRRRQRCPPSGTPSHPPIQGSVAPLVVLSSSPPSLALLPVPSDVPFTFFRTLRLLPPCCLSRRPSRPPVPFRQPIGLGRGVVPSVVWAATFPPPHVLGGTAQCGFFLRSDLEAVLKSIYETIFSPENDETGAHSQQETLEVFLNAATFSKQIEGRTEKFMSLADFRNWCNLVPSVRKFLGSLLLPPDSGRPSFQVPQLEHPENFSSEQLILRKEYAWHIGGALSQNEAEEWKLLYHSALNGLSFNTFLGNIA